MTDELYIGLMSGTSMDGIDAVLVEIGDRSCAIHGTHSLAYPGDLRSRLERAVIDPGAVDLIEIGTLDKQVARSFAAAALGLLKTSNIEATAITAIGSHGQTVLHRPDLPEPFSVQLGDPGTIATAAGITVVADFRNADLALGGQGAPRGPPGSGISSLGVRRHPYQSSGGQYRRHCKCDAPACRWHNHRV